MEHGRSLTMYWAEIVAATHISRKQAEIIMKSKSKWANYLILISGIQEELDLLNVSAYLSHQNAGIGICRKTSPKREEQRFASGCCFTQCKLSWNSNSEIINLTEINSLFFTVCAAS